MVQTLRVLSNIESEKRVKLLVTKFIKAQVPPYDSVFHWVLT